jgi:hypothetical protein
MNKVKIARRERKSCPISSRLELNRTTKPAIGDENDSMRPVLSDDLYRKCADTAHSSRNWDEKENSPDKGPGLAVRVLGEKSLFKYAAEEGRVKTFHYDTLARLASEQKDHLHK